MKHYKSSNIKTPPESMSSKISYGVVIFLLIVGSFGFLLEFLFWALKKFNVQEGFKDRNSIEIYTSVKNDLKSGMPKAC